MLYRALRKTLDSKPSLIPQDSNLNDLIKNSLDWYESLYFYNEEHKKRYSEKGTLAGIRDTTTNQLYWDFDSTDNIEDTFYDAVELINNLITHGITSYGIYFTGSKGIAVKVLLDEFISPATFKSAVYELARDLKTFDKVVNDPNRIIRVVNTKHQKTGLYKVAISLDELETLSIDEIKNLAQEPRLDTPLTPQKLPKLNIKLEVKPEVKEDSKDIDWTNKPKNLTSCRWAMQNGKFSEGLRSNVLITLAATYKNQGWDLEHTYRILKGVCVLQARHSGGERYSDEELYNNIIMQVYSEWWNGGQGTCRQPGWMQDYCTALGEHSCKKDKSEEKTVVEIGEVFHLFDNYVENYEQNVLTTGIKSLDNHSKFLVGTSNAILAAPGVGKTSLALQILNFNSKQNIDCLFFSYDMFHAAVITRMVQKHFGTKYGTTLDTIYKRYKNDSDVRMQVKKMIEEEYKNVKFCFKSGQNANELEETIKETEALIGRKIKLVVVDYNELITSEYSDPTASSSQVAQRLRQIANDQKTCVITLLQPSKLYSSPADEIKSYNAAKGSSSIAQSLTLMLGVCRPGFDPLDMSNDKFFNITCLKNRNGNLFSIDVGWDGLTGRFDELADHELDELRDLREKRRHEKSNDNGW